jgi:hypothetical protein
MPMPALLLLIRAFLLQESADAIEARPEGDRLMRAHRRGQAHACGRPNSPRVTPRPKAAHENAKARP